MFRYFAVMVALALSVILGLLVSHDNIYAQTNQTEGKTTFAPNNNMAAGATSNSTGIMKNTTGMIDDAFDALRDTLGSYFGK